MSHIEAGVAEDDVQLLAPTHDEENKEYQEQLTLLQNQLLMLQSACTQQAPEEEGDDYVPQIARLQQAIRSLRESERLNREDSYPQDEVASVATSASDASVQATFQGTVPERSLKTRWQPQQSESVGSTPPWENSQHGVRQHQPHYLQGKSPEISLLLCLQLAQMS
mmetsp:Transcript_12752/g.24582  ORF Transcript_12752/g.24582 Transcript_12752/m.24582 type:complete len:166 (+) Transcript_12752:124-621(+)